MDSIMENRKLVQTSKRKKMISVDGFLYYANRKIQSTLTRGARRKVIIRRRRKQMPREPTDGDDYQSIDDRYQQTLGGEKFLQTNIATPDGRILIFSTASNMRHLSLAKIWLMDGTFVTAPTNFAQVFSIHGNINEGNVRRFVPLVFMLLPRKNEATYKTAFEGLSEIAADMSLELEPTVIKSDFELALLNASRFVFTKTTLSVTEQASEPIETTTLRTSRKR
ncbi:uncharacterized protein LOC120416610 [Culex pipiens pallens]|uniref:uncharacterized protein LOC120416610 n=1 Tax=Culex pipiens pallens TaxID=42434 RepID=UPI0022AA235B|nr:uncharacterized protein LOC120416610 [Culex pipiens pallens]